MEVVRHPIDVIWALADYTTGSTAQTFEIGQLVTSKTGSATNSTQGLTTMIAAAGAVDTTGKIVPFGIVVGTNNFTKSFDGAATGLSYSSGLEYASSTNTQALQTARDFRGVEGTYPKNDPALYVRIALIGPSTIIKAPIFASTWGTAPTVYTPSAVNGTAGLGFTTSSISPTPTAYMHTWMCRTGANAGIMRTAYDASATAHTFYIYFPYKVAVTDTYVMAPLKQIGTSFAQFDSHAMFVDSAGDYSSNYYVIDVVRLDLRVAGQEAVYFKFNADHFCTARA
jgi:hypothetical protein